MNHFLKIIQDGLTYPDLGGHRRPRVYTLLTLAILGLLILTGSLVLFQRQRVMQLVKSDPVPVSFTMLAPEPTTVATHAMDPLACPIDPSEWDLVNATLTSSYKLIQPACVYAGLERTVAWVLAVRSGYTRNEATRILAFAEIPVMPHEKVMIQSGNGELKDVAVSFAPTHPDLAEWRVDEHGKLAVAYGLRGCFRTSSVSGNRIETWGGDYPVICIVVEDAENSRSVYALDGHIYSATAIPTRSYLLIGYAGNGIWEWLGVQESPKITITDPEKSARDRQLAAALYEAPPWEAAYLMAAYPLEMRPLPEAWLAANDPVEAQSIVEGLNSYIGENQR